MWWGFFIIIILILQFDSPCPGHKGFNTRTRSARGGWGGDGGAIHRALLLASPFCCRNTAWAGVKRGSSFPALSHPLQFKAAGGEQSWERKGSLAGAGVSVPAHLQRHIAHLAFGKCRQTVHDGA